MVKQLTAAGVKRLPVGTFIRRVRESDGAHADYILIKSGIKKVLRLLTSGDVTTEITDRPGWHFERDEK